MSDPEGWKIAVDRIAAEAEAKTGVLDLGNLGLTDFPDELFALTHLRALNLGDGRFDERGAWTFGFGRDVLANDLSTRFSALTQIRSLRQLFLAGLRFDDLSCLAELRDLESLSCFNTQISDLAPLATLTNLQSFDCFNTRVSNIAPLATLVNLQSLNFSLTQVCDLAPLATLVNLQSLVCSNTQVSDLAPLATVEHLQSLVCSATQISDLAPLTAVQSLQTLICSFTQVCDLAPLATQLNLRSLDCGFTQVSNLAPLAKLTNLQVLNCGSTEVSDLAPLATLSNLQSLDCSDTQVSNLAPLAKLANLQSLYCSAMLVSDLAPIAKLANLKSLDCGGTQVSNLAPLATLANLQSLYCSGTQVSNLAPLATLANLQTLYCSGTQVSNLAPLATLADLQLLYCSGTQVSNLAPLATLANLQLLNCANTQVTDLAPVAGLTQLQVLDASSCRLNNSLSGLTEQLVMNRKAEPGIAPRLVLLDTRIPDAPAEVLSESPDDDCLHSLRAHYDDLAAGSEPAADVKLMVLGNGRVGKTQICRRLRGEDFDAKESSTHGIVVSSVSCPGKDDVKLHIWDFGGQDIYHGAHALFMRSNAIFVIVWSPASEDQREHEYDGMIFRNYPLAYWVNYVRHLGGKDAYVLIVQTRCDRPEDKARCPVSEAGRWEAFGPNCYVLHYSAQTDLNRGALNDALTQAVMTLHSNQGVTRIGLGRHRVKLRLEKMRELDATSLPEQRQYRWLTQEQFRQICEEEDGPREPKYLLRYLHNAGIVFHRDNAFDDRIILDQQWALEAIYAVFNRDKCFRQLRQLGGRFTRALLDALVWRERGYSADEQKLFLSMMESCGVCFPLRTGDKALDIETEYVAPDLLPERKLLQHEIDKQWNDDAPVEDAVFEYELLHQGLIRAIISRIGRDAGVSATYWKGGVCVCEKTTRSHALIEQRMINDSAGTIRVAAQGGQSAEMLRQIIRLVTEEQEKLGLKPRSAPDVGRETSRVESPTPGNELEKTQKMAPEFGKAPSPEPSLYVSYAWNDASPDGKKREMIVDQLCAKAEERGTPIRRDKNVLTFGDSISNFMKEIGEGDRVFVILSDKYLKSPFCMYELSEIWRSSKQNETAFLNRCRVYTLEDAKIWSIKDRLAYVDHWQSEYEALAPRAALLGPKSHASLRLMRKFVHEVEEVLSAVADIVQPRNFADLEKYGFDDPPGESR